MDRNVVYAIKVGEVTYSDLSVLRVKIGRTSDLDRTLDQYRRSTPEAEVLDLWQPNPDLELSTCESGTHAVAQQYAYQRDNERFVFLQDGYQKFREAMNKLFSHPQEGETQGEGEEPSPPLRIYSLGEDFDVIGTTPQFVALGGGEKAFRVRWWTNVVALIAREIYYEVDDFSSALDIQGKSRNYFAEEEESLDRAVEIPGTPYFFEGRMNARQRVTTLRRLLDAFGYSLDEIEICLEE